MASSGRCGRFRHCHGMSSPNLTRDWGGALTGVGVAPDADKLLLRSSPPEGGRMGVAPSCPSSGQRRETRRDTLGETLRQEAVEEFQLVTLGGASDAPPSAVRKLRERKDGGVAEAGASSGSPPSAALDALHCCFRCSSIRFRRSSSGERHDLREASAGGPLRGPRRSRRSWRSWQSTLLL